MKAASQEPSQQNQVSKDQASPGCLKLWCCGSLQTATISVGVSNLIMLFVVAAHYIESQLTTIGFNFELVAIVLIFVFLLFVNILLLYGTYKKYNWLLLPWLILHLAAIIGGVIYISIKFHELYGQRAIPLVSTVVLAYFYSIVFSHYMELRKHNSNQIKEAEELANANAKHKECLIDLGVLDESQQQETATNQSSSLFGNDDTFTQIAKRGRGGLHESESGDLAVPDNNPFKASLPTPDEVIDISPKPETNPFLDMTDGNSSDPRGVFVQENSKISSTDPLNAQAVNDAEVNSIANSAKSGPDLNCEPESEPKTQRTRPPSNSKSVAHLGKDSSAGALNEPLLPPAKSEPKIVASHSISNIDNNFSPFRSKSGTAQNGAPLKIFLPSRSQDDDEDDSPFTSDDEAQHPGQLDMSGVVAKSEEL